MRADMSRVIVERPRRLANQMRQWPGDDLWFQPFYVHPRTGLLCRTDRLRKRTSASF